MKGIWMGGNPPLGYDVGNRKLVANPAEAEQVRWIFLRFIEVGSGTVLAGEATERGITRKSGRPIDKKDLYRILNNRVYIGEAVYKGDSYPGEHDAIIEREMWDKVHVILNRPLK